MREEAKEDAQPETKSAHTKKIMRELKKHIVVKGTHDVEPTKVLQ